MNVSKKTLHRINSRRKLKTHTTYLLNKYENQYSHQNELKSAEHTTVNLHVGKHLNKNNKVKPYIELRRDSVTQRRALLDGAAHIYEHLYVNEKQIKAPQPNSTSSRLLKSVVKTPVYLEKAAVKTRNTYKKVYSQLNKPYEVRFKVTRTVDENTGKVSYKQGFAIEELHHRQHKVRGVLHKIDYIRKNKIDSDVKGAAFIPHVVLHSTPFRAAGNVARYVGEHTAFGHGIRAVGNKAKNSVKQIHVSPRLRNLGVHVSNAARTSVNASASAAMKTGLALESGVIKISDDVRYKAKSALVNKFREEMNDDASKSAMLAIGTSASAIKAVTSHFHEKHKNKPFQKAFNERIKNAKKITKKNRRIMKAQNAAYVKSVIAEDKYFKKTGRHIKISDDLQFIVNPVSKLDKIKKKQDKVQKKIYKLQNRSLLSKGIGALSAKSIHSLKNHALQAAGDNDSVKAASVITHNAATGIRKTTKNRNERLNHKLKKYSKRESKLHKKDARFKTTNSKKKNPYKNKNKQFAKDIYKQQAEKKAKRAVFRKKSSRIMAIAAAMLAPIMIMPLVLVSCLGMLGNKGTFAYLTSYYNADVVSLTKASNYYQKLAYDMNYLILNAKDNWKNNLDKYNVPQDYKTEPTKFVYDFSGATFDYNKHKLYSFLTAYTLSDPEDEDEEAKQWVFTDELKTIIETLFNVEYEFESTYSSNVSFEQRSEYEDISGISEDGGLYYTKINSHSVVQHPLNANLYIGVVTGINSAAINDFKSADGKHYYNIVSGEILDVNNNYGATGYYFQNLFVDEKRYNKWYTAKTEGGKTKYYFSCGSNEYKRDGLGYITNSNNYSGYEEKFIIPILDYMFFTSEHGKALSIYENINKNLFLPIPETVRYFLAFSNYGINPNQGYVRILKKYDKLSDCSIHYTVKQKTSFDEAIKNALYSIEGGEENYEYYLALSPDIEPTYYGLHQIGVSPLKEGYRTMIDKNMLQHTFGYEVYGWNVNSCPYSMNYRQHSGVDIKTPSGSAVYAVMDGVISEVGDNYFVIKSDGEEDFKGNISTMYIAYCNVNTEHLNINQAVSKGDFITRTSNKKQEFGYLESLFSANSTQLGLNVVQMQTGFDFLNVACFYELSGTFWGIDPEIVLCLSDKE